MINFPKHATTVMSPTSPPFNVAIIGYGLAAKVFHIPFILALPSSFNLYGIVQRHATSNNSASHDHPNIKTWTSTSSMLSDQSVDLVVITAVPSTHFDLCTQALTAGKHVLCEKPFTPTSSEASQLAALALNSKKVLAVYQNRRWDADFLNLKSLVTPPSQELGRIVEVHTHFDRHRPDPPSPTSVTWKAADNLPAGGAIYDFGTHLLDQLVNLFGMPARVTAFIGNQRIYTEAGTGGDAGGDSFTVLLHYKDGMLATAKAGVVSAEVEQLRYWVRGTKGSFRKYNLDVQEDQLKAGLRPGEDEEFGMETESSNGTVTRLDQSGKPYTSKLKAAHPPATYRAFYEELAKALAGDGKVPVSPEEAAAVIRLIELCKESSTKGRTLDV